MQLLLLLLLQGDSGGPLISYASETAQHYNIIGIAVFNSNCETGNSPDVYTRVTGEYNIYVYIF